MVRIVGDAAPRAVVSKTGMVRKTGMARAVMRKTGIARAVVRKTGMARAVVRKTGMARAVKGGGMDARAAEVERESMDPARMPPTKMPGKMPADVTNADMAAASAEMGGTSASAATMTAAATAPKGVGGAQNEKRSDRDRRHGGDRHDKPP